MYPLIALNMLNEKSVLQIVSPDVLAIDLPQEHYQLVNPDTGEVYRWCCDGHPCVLYTDMEIPNGSLIRSRGQE